MVAIGSDPVPVSLPICVSSLHRSDFVIQRFIRSGCGNMLTKTGNPKSHRQEMLLLVERLRNKQMQSLKGKPSQPLSPSTDERVI